MSRVVKFAMKDGAGYIVTDVTADANVPKKGDAVDGKLTCDGKMLFTNSARNGLLNATVARWSVAAEFVGNQVPIRETCLGLVWHVVGSGKCSEFYAIGATGGCASQDIIAIDVKP